MYDRVTAGVLLLCGDASEMESVLDLPDDQLFTVGSSMNRLQATCVSENRIEKNIIIVNGGRQ